MAKQSTSKSPHNKVTNLKGKNGMVRKNKIVRDMDDKIWNRFTGWCKMNRTKTGEQLTIILQDFMEKNFYKK